MNSNDSITMTIKEAIDARHSVRAYREQPLTEEIVKLLEGKIDELNREGQLHIQLIRNEPKAFQGTLAKYGKFRGVNNYIVMAGKKSDDLDEREIGRMATRHQSREGTAQGLGQCVVGQLAIRSVGPSGFLGRSAADSLLGLRRSLLL